MMLLVLAGICHVNITLQSLVKCRHNQYKFMLLIENGSNLFFTDSCLRREVLIPSKNGRGIHW